MSLDNPRTRAIASLLYLVGALIVLNEVGEWMISVWPLNFGLKNWRFGSIGLLAARLTDLMMGGVFILGAAALLGHTLVLRILGGVQLLLAVLCLGMLGAFALDATELRLQVQPQARRSFYLASGKAAGFILLATVVFIRAGWVCLKANASNAVRAASPKSGGSRKSDESGNTAPGLVFSTSGGEK